MESTVFRGFNLRTVINNNSNVIDNIFANYKESDESEDTYCGYDNLSIGQTLKEAVDEIFDPTAGMTDKQKEDFVQKLESKIKRGEKLSADEMQYLRIHDPIEYAKMAKVQMQRQALESRLKACKSKEEAQKVYTDAMSRISDDDPAREETIAAYNNAYDEFKKSDAYKALPATEKEAKDKENTDD